MATLVSHDVAPFSCLERGQTLDHELNQRHAPCPLKPNWTVVEQARS